MTRTDDWKKAVWGGRIDPETRACFCVGPQNGEPLCPCAMRAKRDETNRAWLDGYEAGKRAAEKGTAK